jgi:hypothetical protein
MLSRIVERSDCALAFWGKTTKELSRRYSGATAKVSHCAAEIAAGWRSGLVCDRLWRCDFSFPMLVIVAHKTAVACLHHRRKRP